MNKLQRHNKILEIIRRNEITTQQELVYKLQEEGYNLTQATVSRDIKELGLIKKAFGQNKSKYALMEHVPEKNYSEKLANIFMECVSSIKSSLNILVIKTMVGSANSVAAYIDEMDIDGILGSVAGDDTIIIVVNSVDRAEEIVEKLKNIKNKK